MSNETLTTQETSTNILDELTEEEKQRIRENFAEYLKEEFGDELEAQGFNEWVERKPYIDLPAEEQATLRERYSDEKWGWREGELETYLVWRPEFSDPDFNGVFVDGNIPITDRGVSRWFEKFWKVFRDAASKYAISAIDYLEETGVVNSNYDPAAFNGRQGIAGWTLALCTISEGQLAKQASTELRIQQEETQFAAYLADELHTKALRMKNLAEEMYELDALYNSILLGRNLLDVEYQNTNGDFVTQEQYIDKMNTEANRRYTQEQEDEQERIRREWREKQIAEFDEWRAARLEAIDNFEKTTGLPIGVLIQEAEEEHF